MQVVYLGVIVLECLGSKTLETTNHVVEVVFKCKVVIQQWNVPRVINYWDGVTQEVRGAH